jgi:hypothetical protein
MGLRRITHGQFVSDGTKWGTLGAKRLARLESGETKDIAIKPTAPSEVVVTPGASSWTARCGLVASERGERNQEIKQVPPPEGSVSKRREIVRARPTVLAVPPGKGNGREHQDSGRRHLLVKEIVNDPRPSNIAALRPLEDLSAKNGRFHQSIPEAFSTAIPCGEAGAVLGARRSQGPVGNMELNNRHARLKSWLF